MLSGGLDIQKIAEKEDCAKWHLMRLGKRIDDFLAEAFIELSVLQHFPRESDEKPTNQTR